MALVEPIVYQVAGYQNSGKTTFLVKLIEELKKLGLMTVTIKHHGHGGRPDVLPQKDSSRHLEAGAAASLVEGEGRIVLQADDLFLTLTEQIRFMNFFKPDIILVEGHKKQPYPKLLLLRDENDLSLIDDVENIQAVIVWKKALIEVVCHQVKVPVFDIEDQLAVPEIAKVLKKQVHHIDEKL
jgi:molybdopterin-guanine dinucleotide biosynthesis adapter protein